MTKGSEPSNKLVGPYHWSGIWKIVTALCISLVILPFSLLVVGLAIVPFPDCRNCELIGLQAPLGKFTNSDLTGVEMWFTDLRKGRMNGGA